MQNFVAIGSGVSAPRIRDYAVPFDVISLTFVFFLGGGFFNKLQPTPPNIFLRKMRQKPSFRVRKSIPGGPDNYI